jgi:predicted nuclease with RNAse H fold
VTVVGIDVGGERKGFHGCAIEGREVVAGPIRLRTVAEAAEWVAALVPTTVALDGPCEPAATGERSRADEREFARARICGIRWTPEEAGLDGAYYAWIVHGLALYKALERAVPAADLIEVFPTAAWTRWIGPRERRGRAAWTSAGLEALGGSALDLHGLAARTGKPRLGQDDRDAIAAALVARQHEEGETVAHGKIIVPVGPLP